MTPTPESPRATAEWAATRSILGTLFTILAVAALLALAYALRSVGLLLMLSVLFSYLVAPLVAAAELPFPFRGRTRALSRGWAIAAVYTTFVSLLGGGLYIMVPRIAHQIGSLDEQMPMMFSAQRDWGQSLIDKLNAYQLPPAVRNAIDQVAQQAIASIRRNLRSGLMEAAGLLRYVPWLVLIPVISVFLLKDATGFRRSFLNLLPEGRVRWRGREFFEDVNQTIAFYVRAQLIACLIIGVACTIGFFALSVPYALLLGVFAGMVELIPLVGPLLTMIAAGLIAAYHSTPLAIYTVIYLLVIRIIHDNVTYPRLIASGIKLHPLAVILALLCGSQLAGLIGLFLAIPITALLSVSYRHLSRQWHGDGLFTALVEAREPEPLPVPPVNLASVPRVTTAPTLPLAGVRVLAVDDDDDGRAMVSDLLEGQGAAVATAGSVSQALDVLAAQRFDVILCDIGMPGEDGFELIRRVRALKNEAGGDTPAAALSGYNTAEDRQRGSAAGFQSHLGKPIDATELLTTVASLAQMSRQRRAVG